MRRPSYVRTSAKGNIALELIYAAVETATHKEKAGHLPFAMRYGERVAATKEKSPPFAKNAQDGAPEKCSGVDSRLGPLNFRCGYVLNGKFEFRSKKVLPLSFESPTPHL